MILIIFIKSNNPGSYNVNMMPYRIALKDSALTKLAYKQARLITGMKEIFLK